jgi:lipopolysaccharide export system permease protein
MQPLSTVSLTRIIAFLLSAMGLVLFAGSAAAALPTALLALALALRRDRRGHFTAALMESVGISLGFWLVQALSYSVGLSGRLPPLLAAWMAVGLALLPGAVALRRLA